MSKWCHFPPSPADRLPPRDYLEAAPAEPTGAGTDIMAALGTTADRLAGENLQALVLLSDGRPTHGASRSQRRHRLNRPVFAIGLGDTLPARDLAIGRCDYAPVAYVESEAEIAVRLESAGYRGQATTLRLLHEGRELFQQRIAFDLDLGRSTVRVPLRLTTPGRQRYRLVLDPLPGEFTEKNNTREISIEVLKNRIRVLVIAARPDWDVAFWRGRCATIRTCASRSRTRMPAAPGSAAMKHGRCRCRAVRLGSVTTICTWSPHRVEGLSADVARELATAVERARGSCCSQGARAHSGMRPFGMHWRRPCR
jgi:hypothetical protein